MFERGALDDVIIYNFETKGVEEARFPATIQTSGKIYTKEAKSIAEVNAVIDETTSKWNRYFEIPVLSTEKIITISAGRIEPDMAGERGTIQTGIFNDMDKNLKLIDIDEDYKEEPGVLPCYMSKYTMEDKNLSVGETLELTAMENDKGETPKLRIIGIAEPCDNGDYYWYDSLRKNKEMLILREEYLDKMIAEYGVESVSYEVYEMLDYRAIDSSNIKATNSYLSQFGSLDMQFKSNFDGILDDYMETAGSSAVAACNRLVKYAGGMLATDLEIDTQATLISDEFHQIGENRLEVLRTVAGSMGWRVGVGRDGDVVLTPYSRPVDRPVRYTFDDTANGIALVGFSESSTRSEAVNRVVAWWSRESLPSPDDGTAAWGLTARYMADLAEDRPFSYQRTGRRRTHAMQLSEPCSPPNIHWATRDCSLWTT